MFCNANVGMVDAVTKKYPGKFKMDTRPAADHRAELEQHGIKSHGVICLHEGKTVWKHGDHKLSQAQLDAGVEVVLEALK